MEMAPKIIRRVLFFWRGLLAQCGPHSIRDNYQPCKLSNHLSSSLLICGSAPLGWWRRCWTPNSFWTAWCIQLCLKMMLATDASISFIGYWRRIWLNDSELDFDMMMSHPYFAGVYTFLILSWELFVDNACKDWKAMKSFRLCYLLGFWTSSRDIISLKTGVSLSILFQKAWGWRSYSAWLCLYLTLKLQSNSTLRFGLWFP